jgi:hypothetical protein
VQNPHLHKNSILTVRFGDAFLILVQSQLTQKKEASQTFPRVCSGLGFLG